MRKFFLIATTSSLTLLLSGCAWLFPDYYAEKYDDILDSSELPSINYTTTFNEDLDPEINRPLRAISLLSRLENRPPGSISALKQRARIDIKHLKQAMSSLGYFDAKVSYRINKKVSPVTVDITVIPGQRYTISSLSIVVDEMGKTTFDLTPSKAREALLFDIGDEVDLTKIQESAQKLQLFFQQRGFALTKTTDTEGKIDRSTKKLQVTFHVTPGPPTSFGPSKIQGSKKVCEQFIRNRLVWHEGEAFDERKIEKTRKKLVQSGLFSAVDMKVAEESTKDNLIPIDLTVIEAPFRTLGAGLKYSSYDRLSGSVYWHHNNLFGSGEHFGTLLEYSPRYRTAKLSFDLPDFIVPEQKLLTEVRLTREDTNAYFNRTASSGMRVERSFWDFLAVSTGINGEIGKVRREGRVFKNRLVSFPSEIKLDVSNDILNPTVGGRLSFKVTPYKGRIGKKHSMTVARLGGSHYLPIIQKERAILATWGTLGTIHVHDIKDVSPNKRFYSGGGGSIRGYGYQLLGPVDRRKVPTGGRSLFECGVEARVKITDNFGLVAFFEGGSVSNNPLPDLRARNRRNQRNLLWGTGLGGRYFTTIGPIRVDIAIPLKIRHTISGRRIDAPYQIYVSVGQAF